MVHWITSASPRNDERMLGVTLALAIMIHQTIRSRINSPGGYVHNMIERAERGQFDIRRSYYGMHARIPISPNATRN